MRRAERVISLMAVLFLAACQNQGSLAVEQAKTQAAAERKTIVESCAAALERVQQISDAYGQTLAYIVIAQAQAKLGDVSMVRATLDKAKAAATKIGGRDGAGGRDRDPVIAYLAMIELQAAMGDVAGAEETAALIPDESRMPAYLTIAQAKAKAGDLPGAYYLCDLARTAAGKSDRRFRSSNALECYAVAVAQAKIGDFIGAKRTAAMIFDGSITGSLTIYRTYAAREIAYFQAKAGDVAGAKKANHAKYGHTDSYDLWSYSRIVAAQVDASDIDGARETVEQAKEITEQIDYPDYKIDAYIAVATAHVKLGDLDEARKTLIKARDEVPGIQRNEWDKPKAYQRIIAFQVKFKDFTEATKTVELIASVDADKADSSLLRTCQNIIAAQANAGDLAGARKTFDIIKEVATKIADKSLLVETTGYKRDDIVRARDRTIAGAQATAGDINGAKETVTLINDDDYQAEAYQYIAAAQAKAGDMAGARKTLKMVKAEESSGGRSRDYWAEACVAVVQTQLKNEHLMSAILFIVAVTSELGVEWGKAYWDE